ncbi:transcriptional regulator [Neiella marina]|uniref:Transcriptional regulator n=1 Tax=Neiella marina TaxID=508461 RepID=A0A8J2U5T3_9GAMM|nr:EAL domain-containing response regulator [Neiella marina]GGA80907.1 transcriptional regulator [Neiella marina]
MSEPVVSATKGIEAMITANVLILEDDRFQSRLMESMVKGLTSGHVAIAANGHEALEHLKAEPLPHLILCDIQMPEMDGIEFLRALAGLSHQCSVALTSAIDSNIIDSVLQMARWYGINNVSKVEKPIQQQAILRLLKQAQQVEEAESKSWPQYAFSDDDIIEAVASQMVPFYQPHVAAKSREIVGAEALIRWQHPEHGTLTPNHFLQQIEQLGLSHQLTLKVLQQGIADCARWHQLGMPLHISINVSASDMVELAFVDSVLAILNEHQLPAQYLTLELTETEISPHLAKSLDTMSRLRINKINLSIDDFGTGHSSLHQLITSPFNELKVDMAFVRHMLTSDKHQATVSASLVLAKQLGLKTVAEGVETQEQANKLADLGCDILQGYVYSPALQGDQFIEWYKANPIG